MSDEEQARETERRRLAWEEAKMIWRARDAYEGENLLMGCGLFLVIGIGAMALLSTPPWLAKATVGVILAWWIWKTFT